MLGPTQIAQRQINWWQPLMSWKVCGRRRSLTCWGTGRTRAQVVSRRLSTSATARIPSQVRSCEIYGRQSGTGEGFPRVLLFPQSSRIPLTAPHSSSSPSPSIIRGWHNRPNVEDTPSGRSLTRPQEIKIIRNTVPAISSGGWGKSSQNSVTVVGMPAKSRTGHLADTSHKLYRSEQLRRAVADKWHCRRV
jgi:hypothetical protein